MAQSFNSVRNKKSLTQQMLAPKQIPEVKFPDNDPYHFPHFTATRLLSFKENGKVVAEGELGTIPVTWDDLFILYYPTAILLDNKLFTFESNQVVKKLSTPKSMKYTFCYFNQNNNTHKNVGKSATEPNLEEKLLEFVLENEKALHRFGPDVMVVKINMKSGICSLM